VHLDYKNISQENEILQQIIKDRRRMLKDFKIFIDHPLIQVLWFGDYTGSGFSKGLKAHLQK